MAVPPKHTPKWSFLVGKPMVVGETHHFRKPPLDILSNTRFGSIFRKSSRKLDDKIWQSWGFEPRRWKSRRKDEAKHLKDMKPTEKRQDGNCLTFMDFITFLCLKPIFLDFLRLKSWFYTPPQYPSCVVTSSDRDTWDWIFPIGLGFCLCVPWVKQRWFWDHHKIGRLDHVLRFLTGIADSLWEV